VGSPAAQPRPAGETRPPAPIAAGDRTGAKSSSGRGIAIGAFVALIVVAAAAALWFSPARDPRTVTETPDQTLTQKPAAVAEPIVVSPSVSQPASAPAAPATTRPPGNASASPPRPASPTSRPEITSTPSPPPANTAAAPNVVGKTIPEAREILRQAGFRFLIRIHEDKSKEPGLVETQRLDESTGSNQSRRVLLTAVAISTVLIHIVAGDEQKANDLVAYLREQPSTIGTMVRVQSAVPRAELLGVVGYSEERLATQAAAIARDATEYLARAGTRRSLQAAVRPRVARGTIIMGLYERAP
jgi:hypothetical protein